MPNPVNFRHDVLVALAEEYVATDWSEDALDAIATIAQNLGIVWDDNSFYLDFETEVEIVYSKAQRIRRFSTAPEPDPEIIHSEPSENWAEPENWGDYPSEADSVEESKETFTN